MKDNENDVLNNDLDNDSIVVGTSNTVEEIILNEDVDKAPVEQATEEIEKKVEETNVSTPPEPKESNKKNRWLIAIGLALVILLLIYILSNTNKDEPIDTPTNDIATEEGEEILNPTESEIIEDAESTESEVPVEDNIEDAVEDEEPVADNSLDKTVTNETWSDIDKALKAINEYISNPTVSNRFVSNGGYLYSVNTDDIVDYSRILDDSDYPNLKLKHGHLLYIFSDDLVDFPTLRISENKELEVFYAYQTEEGYAISSSLSGGGIISKEEFEGLINKYSSKHSEIIRPGIKDPEFMELNFMSLMTMVEDTKSSDDNVDTRFLQYDDTFAVVVTSLRSTPEDVHAFLYEKVLGDWLLIEKSFNLQPNYYQYINNKYPYVNIQLLPKYDLDENAPDDYITNMNPITDGMLTVNQITQEDLPLIYGIGYDNCYYLEFTSGKAFVGVGNNTGGITTYPVKTVAEVVSILDEHVRRPPYIIFKQY